MINMTILIIFRDRLVSQQQVAKSIHQSLPAGRDDRRRIVLEDHGRAGKTVARL